MTGQELQKSLNAARGFIDLGMFEDAWNELENLPPEFRADDVVLALRIEIFQGMEKWESSRMLAESLAKRSPENPGWWLSWTYALRRELSIEAAQEVLREAARLHPDVAMISYNLACYACVLGNIDEAKDLLKRACEMDQVFKKMALDDPDLNAIFGREKPSP